MGKFLGNYFKKRFEKTLKETDFSLKPRFPVNSLIEVTNTCNHKCIFCKNTNQSRKTTYLNKDVYKKFIKEASAFGLKEVGLYATGEPFMAKNLDEYISIAKAYNIERVYITTNGALADLKSVIKCVEAGLDSIKFSINASNKEDYIRIHGHNDFSKVLKNVSEIFEWKNINKKNLQMLCTCVVLPSKKYVVKEHQKLFSDYFEDIDYNLSSSQGGQSYDIPLDETALGAIFQEKTELNDSDIQPCEIVFNRYHLTAEGYLTACCVDYNLNLAYSDLNVEDLKSGWLNTWITKLREMHLNKKLDGTICHQCLRNKKLPYKPIRSLSAKFMDADKAIKVENQLQKRIINFSK